MAVDTAAQVLAGRLPSTKLLRAMSYGERAATYPLAFSWSVAGTHQRKYITFCVLEATRPGATPLHFFPCTQARLLDYIEWLPNHGCDGTAWDSIRHYVRAVREWSERLGWGDPKFEDKRFYDKFQLNFIANRKVRKRPRGGQEILVEVSDDAVDAAGLHVHLPALLATVITLKIHIHS